MTVVEKIEHALGMDESKPGMYRNPSSRHCLFSQVRASIEADMYCTSSFRHIRLPRRNVQSPCPDPIPR